MLQRCQHCARILGIERQVLRLCIVPTLLQTSGTSRCYQHVHVGSCIRLCTVSGKVFCRTALETFQWLSITTPRIGSLSLAFSTWFSTLAPVSGKGIWGKKGSIAVTKPFELLVIGLMAIRYLLKLFLRYLLWGLVENLRHRCLATSRLHTTHFPTLHHCHWGYHTKHWFHCQLHHCQYQCMRKTHDPCKTFRIVGIVLHHLLREPRQNFGSLHWALVQ